jgi:acyl transferase domain-containing protein
LTTAVQLALVAVYRNWGIKFTSVIGHSSGEIAAACTAGLVSRSEAIAIAYYCGWSASKVTKSEGRTPFSTGMLAAATDASHIEKILSEEAIKQVEIACYNGPGAVTLSGPMPALKRVQAILNQQGQRSTILNNPVAYHHPHLMAEAGQVYESKLKKVLPSDGLRMAKNSTRWPMLSTVTTNPTSTAVSDAAYWKNNILSVVRFEETLTKALTGPNAPRILIEVGPSAALSGAVQGIKSKIGPKAADVTYYKSIGKGKAAIVPMFQTAGGLFLAGAEIDLARVNN